MRIIQDIPNLASIKLRDCTYRVDFSEAQTKKKLTIMLPGPTGLTALCEVPAMSRSEIIKVLVRINAYTKARDEIKALLKEGLKVVSPMDTWPSIVKEDMPGPKGNLWATIEEDTKKKRK